MVDAGATEMTEEQLPRILVVCTANITRSPIAHQLLEAYFVRALPEWRRPVVSSAGTHAREGDPADPPMAEIATAWKLSPELHRSRKVTRDVATENDLIVTMERRHQQVVAGLGPRLAERTFRLTELAGLLDVVGAEGAAALVVDDATPRQRLQALVAHAHGLRVRTLVDATDVADPHGGPPEPYKDTAWELAALVERVGVVLAAVLDG